MTIPHFTATIYIAYPLYAKHRKAIDEIADSKFVPGANVKSLVVTPEQFRELTEECGFGVNDFMLRSSALQLTKEEAAP